MKKSNQKPGPGRDMSRRNFLKAGSLATVFGLSGAVEIKAAPAVHTRRADEPVRAALIGFGQWGREIAATMGRIPEYQLVAVADTYDVMLRRVQRSVPGASTHTDYREVLDNPEVQAVFIATPTHQHKDVALAALQAGKHVYVEAPLAASIDDARAMAVAAKGTPKQIFQVGHLYRSNPQHRSIFQFIRSGAIGTPAMVRAQHHMKESWRRASPNREREVEQNWRLDPAVSIGLVGELGVHQFDTAGWFLQTRPVAVTGFGQVRSWNDGRTMPDTVQAVIELSNGANMLYDATLASSFDDEYDMFYGSDSTIMLRDSKAWMFKEVDAPMLGWEVYARKDRFYRENGIALVANATQLDAQAAEPWEDDPNVETPLFYALKEFVDNMNFGPYEPSASYRVGYENAVIGVKAHEAVMNQQRVTIDDGMFEL